MSTAPGGGGGGSVDVRMEPDEVRAVASALTDAGGAMDEVGSSSPGGGDHGLAGPLLATIMARVCETGARLVVEAETLSETVRACHDTTVETDRAAAERFLVSGESG